MADDRPLSSEEMIRRARQELSRQPQVAEPDLSDGLVPDDEPEPAADGPRFGAANRASPPKRTRPRPVPPDPFTGEPVSHQQQANARAIAVLVAVVVAIMGIAVALAAIASSAP